MSEKEKKIKEINEKRKQTCLKKYGVEYPAQSKKIQKKMEKVCVKKYGVKYPAQSKEIHEKMKQTCIEKYGSESSLGNEKIQEKRKQTCIEKYGVGNPYQILEIRQKLKHLYSKPHKKIARFLENQNINMEIEKNIHPYWVDIFIKPDKIIEIYGDYWHGNPKFFEKNDEISLPQGKLSVKEKWQKDKERIKFLEKQGNKILILWEDEINNEFENIIVKVNKFIEVR